MRCLLSLILMLALSLWSGCGGDDNPTVPAVVDSGAVSIGAGGGSLRVTGPDGLLVVAEVPAGAVLVDTEFWIRPAAAKSGTLFEIGPAGVLLLQPIDLRVTIPEAWGDPGDYVVSMGQGVDRVGLPATVDGETGDLRVETYYLGYPGGAKTTSSTLDVSELQCQIELDFLNDRVAQTQAWFTASGSASIAGESLSALRSQYKLVAANCGGAPPAIQQALAVMACAEWDDAVLNADVLIAPQNQVELEELIQPLIAARSLGLLVAANCSGDLVPELDKVVTKYVDGLIDRISTPGYIDDTPWDALWGELLTSAHRLRAGASLWDVPDALPKINEELLPLQYEQLRLAAFEACDEFNDQSFIADLLTGGYTHAHPVEGGGGVPWWADITADELVQDAQYCGSPLTIEVYDAVVELVDTYGLGPGNAPGEETNEVGIEAPYDGFIDLTGPVRALLCYNPAGSPAYSDDSLVIRANSVDQATISATSTGAYLDTAEDISVGLLLEELGLPEEPGQEFEIVVSREGSVCDGEYGPAEFDLFVIHVTTTDGSCDETKAPCEPYLTLDFDFPAEVEEDDPVYFSVSGRINYPQSGSSVPVASAQVTLTVEGGTASPSSGELDSHGKFFSEITVTPGADEVVVIAVMETTEGLGGEASVSAVNLDALPIRVTHNYVAVWLTANVTNGTLYSFHWENGTRLGTSYTLNQTRTSTGTAPLSNGSVTSVTNVSSILLYDEITGHFRGWDIDALASIDVNHSGYVEESPEENVFCEAKAQISVTMRFRINSGSYALEASGDFTLLPIDEEIGYSRGAFFGTDGYQIDTRDDQFGISQSTTLGPGEYYLSVGVQSRNVARHLPFDAEAATSLDISLTPLD